jgi:anaerobic magnesium-protoporphyrin IX monomethyl ester cyclase
MKILFCNPPTADGSAFVREGRCEHRAASFQYLMAPISLPSCAAVARDAGHEVAVLDCVAEGLDVAGLVQAVPWADADLAVLAVTTPTFDGDAAAARALQDSTGAHVAAIGVHVSALAEESLESGAFDSIVRGEPERTVGGLADALAAGLPLSKVEGLSFREARGVHHNPDRPFIEDLDTLPFPARDLLHNERYLAPLSNLTQTPVMPSRGCPWPCTYCTAACYYGKRIRSRSAASVVDEMQECIESFGIEEILMWADTFLADRPLVTGVCSEIRVRGLDVRWTCNSRVDTVDPGILREIRDAGCWAVAYGVESGSQQVLDRSRKGTTVAQARDAIRWTREAGLTSMAHIVVGLPGETGSTVDETIALLREADPDYVQVYCAVPFPGSELYDTARAEGWILDEDWAAFEQSRANMGTAEFTAAQAAAARERVFRGFYLRTPYIARRLSDARSPSELRRLSRGAIDFVRQWASRA